MHHRKHLLSLVSLLALVTCREPVAEGMLLPTALAQAQTYGMEIHGALEVRSTSYHHTFAPVVAAADHTLMLPFDGVPAGIYSFIVHVTGIVNGQELALLDYTQINVNVGSGSGNEWSASGGTWTIATPNGQPADADGDGISDFDELVYGLNPTGQFTLLATPAAGEAVVGLSGTDLRFLLYATTDHVSYLGNQALVALTDPLTDPASVRAVPRSPLNLVGDTCASATLASIAVAGNRGLVAGSNGCLFTVGASNSGISLPPSGATAIEVYGHTTSLITPPEAAAATVGFDWEKAAISLDQPTASSWAIALIGKAETQPVIANIDADTSSSIILSNEATVGLSAAMSPPSSDLRITDALVGCGREGITSRLFGTADHLYVDYGSALDLPGVMRLYAVASRINTQTSPHQCELFAAGTTSGTPVSVTVGSGRCDIPSTVDATSCRVFTPDSNWATGPATVGTPTAIVFGRTTVVRDPTTSVAVEALFLADDRGRIFYSTAIPTGNATPDWQFLGTVPDEQPIVSLVASAVDDETGAMPALFVATHRNVYRVP